MEGLAMVDALEEDLRAADVSQKEQFVRLRVRHRQMEALEQLEDDLATPLPHSKQSRDTVREHTRALKGEIRADIAVVECNIRRQDRLVDDSSLRTNESTHINSQPSTGSRVQRDLNQNHESSQPNSDSSSNSSNSTTTTVTSHLDSFLNSTKVRHMDMPRNAQYPVTENSAAAAAAQLETVSVMASANVSSQCYNTCNASCLRPTTNTSTSPVYTQMGKDAAITQTFQRLSEEAQWVDQQGERSRTESEQRLLCLIERMVTRVDALESRFESVNVNQIVSRVQNLEAGMQERMRQGHIVETLSHRVDTTLAQLRVQFEQQLELERERTIATVTTVEQEPNIDMIAIAAMIDEANSKFQSEVKSKHRQQLANMEIDRKVETSDAKRRFEALNAQVKLLQNSLQDEHKTSIRALELMLAQSTRSADFAITLESLSATTTAPSLSPVPPPSPAGLLSDSHLHDNYRRSVAAASLQRKCLQQRPQQQQQYVRSGDPNKQLLFKTHQHQHSTDESAEAGENGYVMRDAVSDVIAEACMQGQDHHRHPCQSRSPMGLWVDVREQVCRRQGTGNTIKGRDSKDTCSNITSKGSGITGGRVDAQRPPTAEDMHVLRDQYYVGRQREKSHQQQPQQQHHQQPQQQQQQQHDDALDQAKRRLKFTRQGVHLQQTPVSREGAIGGSRNAFLSLQSPNKFERVRQDRTGDTTSSAHEKYNGQSVTIRPHTRQVSQAK